MPRKPITFPHQNWGWPACAGGVLKWGSIGSRWRQTSRRSWRSRWCSPQFWCFQWSTTWLCLGDWRLCIICNGDVLQIVFFLKMLLGFPQEPWTLIAGFPSFLRGWRDSQRRLPQGDKRIRFNLGKHIVIVALHSLILVFEHTAWFAPTLLCSFWFSSLLFLLIHFICPNIGCNTGDFPSSSGFCAFQTQGLPQKGWNTLYPWATLFYEPYKADSIYGAFLDPGVLQQKKRFDAFWCVYLAQTCKHWMHLNAVLFVSTRGVCTQ